MEMSQTVIIQPCIVVRKLVVTGRQQSTAQPRADPALESQLWSPVPVVPALELGVNDTVSLSISSSFLIYETGIILKAEDYCED